MLRALHVPIVHIREKYFAFHIFADYQSIPIWDQRLFSGHVPIVVTKRKLKRLDVRIVYKNEDMSQ